MTTDVRGLSVLSVIDNSPVLVRADGWGSDAPGFVLEAHVEAVVIAPQSLCAARTSEELRSVRRMPGSGDAQRDSIAAYCQAHEAAEALAWKGVDGPYVRRLLDPTGDDAWVEKETCDMLNEPANTGNGWFVFVPFDSGLGTHRIYGLVGVHLHGWASARYGYGGVEAVKLHLDACRRDALALARKEAHLLAQWHDGGCHRVMVQRTSESGNRTWKQTIYAVGDFAYCTRVGDHID